MISVQITNSGASSAGVCQSGGVAQSLTRQPLPMLRQCALLLQALHRQVQPPVRLVSLIRMVISFNAHAVRGSTANDRSPPRRVSPRELDLWRTCDPKRIGPPGWWPVRWVNCAGSDLPGQPPRWQAAGTVLVPPAVRPHSPIGRGSGLKIRTVSVRVRLGAQQPAIHTLVTVGSSGAGVSGL